MGFLALLSHPIRLTLTIVAASIGRLEATIQSYRAVEQGLTIFRCGSWAPSTVWDPHHQIYGYKYNLGSGTFTAEIPLRSHVSTILHGCWKPMGLHLLCVRHSIVHLGDRAKEIDRPMAQICRESRLLRRHGSSRHHSTNGASGSALASETREESA